MVTVERLKIITLQVSGLFHLANNVTSSTHEGPLMAKTVVGWALLALGSALLRYSCRPR